MTKQQTNKALASVATIIPVLPVTEVIPEIVPELIPVLPVTEDAPVKAGNKADYDEKRGEFFDEVREMGATAGKGSLSLFEVAMKYQSMVATGYATAADADKVYDSYAEGYRIAIAGPEGVKQGAEAMPERSKAAQISRLRSYAGKGPVTLGETLYSQILAVRKMVAMEDLGGVSSTSNFYAVNNAIGKVVDAANGDTAGIVATMQDEVASEAFIRGVIVKTKADTDPMKQFGEMVKKAQSLGKNTFVGNADFDKWVKYGAWLHSQMAAAGAARPTMDEAA